MNKHVYAVFIILWVLTFVPAWRMLIKLLAYTISDNKLGLRFITYFMAYRLVIALPYLYLLIFGQEVSGFIKSIVWGVLILGLTLSVTRFFFRERAIISLWNLYSLFYDGLMNFYPYTNLIDKVAKRALESNPTRLLDVGCGTGNVGNLLASKMPDSTITAIDSSRGMIKRAHGKLSHLKNIHLEEIPIIDYLKSLDKEKFDAIILVNVLYAVQDRDLFWRLALSHLNTNGRLIVTSSDRGGSWPIIKEHIQHRNFISLVKPRLIGVFLIDLFISQLASAGKFEFISLNRLKSEIHKAGGIVDNVERCYGGSQDGVNLLFTVTLKG